MPFDPNSLQIEGEPQQPSSSFDPGSQLKPVDPIVQPPDLTYQSSIARGARRGLESLPVGANELLPRPIPGTSGMRQDVMTPSQNLPEALAYGLAAGAPGAALSAFLPGTLPWVVGQGALEGALQPTQGGTALEHGAGALGGATTSGALGGLGRSLTASPEVKSLISQGVRPTAGRTFPFFRPSEWFLRRVGGPAQAIARMENMSIDDLNRWAYRQVGETLPGLQMPTEVGRKGLDELQTGIVGRLNAANAQTTFSISPAFGNDVAQIRNDLSQTGAPASAIRAFENTVRNNVTSVVTRSTGASLPGAQVTGVGGIIPNLRRLSEKAWQSGNPASQSLARAYDDLQDAILKNSMGPGAAERDAARQAYARYMSLERSVRGRTDGRTDAGRMLDEMEKENRSSYARGRMRSQQFVESAQRNLPTLEQAKANPSWWETMLFYGGAPAFRAATGDPRAFAELAPLVTLPAYTRPGRSVLSGMARSNAAQRAAKYLAPAAGVGGAAAVQDFLPTGGATP